MRIFQPMLAFGGNLPPSWRSHASSSGADTRFGFTRSARVGIESRRLVLSSWSSAAGMTTSI